MSMRCGWPRRSGAPASSSRQDRLTVAVLGLGGNLGDPRELMAEAIRRLATHPDIVLESVSALYRHAALGQDRSACLPERRGAN